VVVPVPLPAVVEGDQEEVQPLQGFQGRPGVRATGDRRAQRCGQAVQDRRLEEEGPDLVGLTVQDLVDEVVDDETVVAGEVGDEHRRVVATSERQCGELQRGDPPLCPRFEGVHVGGGEVESHRIVQVGRRLLLGEAQVGGTHLEQLAARPQAGEGPGWIGPGGHDQVQLFR
jgi:hypothetical protein